MEAGRVVDTGEATVLFEILLQQFGDMFRLDLRAGLVESSADLDEASGTFRAHKFSPRILDVFQFSLQHQHGYFRPLYGI